VEYKYSAVGLLISRRAFILLRLWLFYFRQF